MSEYPKMLTAVLKRPGDPDRVVPVYFRRDHPDRGGQLVIFQDRKDEKEFKAADGVVHSGAPEQHSSPEPMWPYSYQQPWWVDTFHQRRKEGTP
jgi:hypothetical protein